MKSISELLGEGNKDKASMLNAALDKFEAVINTDAFEKLMDKLSLILSDADCQVIPSENNSGGVMKRDALMAFGEHLMLLTDTDPEGVPPKFIPYSMDLLMFLVQKEGFSPREVIGIAASLLMNLVINTYVLGETRDDGSTQGS